MMLPSKIVGSIQTSRGVQPFVLDGARGSVRLGQYEPADAMQSSLGSMERKAIDTQLRGEVSGVRTVRLGEYRCTQCSRWIDVVASPQDWDGDLCATCAP
jgi:hypothetical protein